MDKLLVNRILMVLEGQRFADWYTSGNFDKFMTNETKGEITPDQIRQEIYNMFLKDLGKYELDGST